MIVVLDREFRMYDSNDEEISYAISELEQAIESNIKTHADVIRNMTDEELAEFLETYSICEHCKYDSNHSCTLQNPCVHALAQSIVLQWLQAEAKGDSEC